MQELKHCSSAYFVTLTYEDKNLTFNGDGDPVLMKRDVQLFMKKIRFHLSKIPSYSGQEKKFKYFLVGEYGGKTDRPHYHGLFFNIPVCVDVPKFLEKYWNNGHIHYGSVSVKSISYTAKYVINDVEKIVDKPSGFAIMSLRPAIGYGYVDAFKDWHRKNKAFYGLLEGKKVSLPRYYKSKIFTSKEILENLKKYQETADELIKQKIKNAPDYFMSEEIRKFQLQSSITNRSKNNSKL